MNSMVKGQYSYGGRWYISPVHTSNSKVIQPQFENGNFDEPASIVASSLPPQGVETVVHLSFLWQFFVYMFKKSSEHSQRRSSKMVKADAICQKFQMRFELPNHNRVANDDDIITNHVWITLCEQGYRVCCLESKRPHFSKILMNHNKKEKVQTDSHVHRML